MRNPESYRQKEKQKDNLLLLSILIVIFAAALGLRWYSDTHQPPVHSLKVTIREEGIPRTPLHSVSTQYFARGYLQAIDNMKELAKGHQEIIDDKIVWELLDVQQRKTASDSWAPLQISPQEPPAQKPPAQKQLDRMALPPFPLKIGGGREMAYARLNSIASHAGEWKFTVRCSVHYYDPDTKEEWAGSALHTLIRPLKEDKDAAYRVARGLPEPTSTPPSGRRPFVPGKVYIGGIQWSDDSGQWCDIPQKGQKGFPLKVTLDAVTGFRAKKKNPREPWPNWAGTENEFFSILVWGGNIAPKGGLTGESVWIKPGEQNALSLDDKDLKTISVTCGNTVTRQILVTLPNQGNA